MSNPGVSPTGVINLYSNTLLNIGRYEMYACKYFNDDEGHASNNNDN